jgi:hypothetical protein
MMSLRESSLILCLLLTGCGGNELMPVTGSVHYDDGTVPVGGLSMLRFTPTADSPSPSRRAVEGTINPTDGTFELMTYRPGDGVHAGEYHVSFTVRKNYMEPESAMPPEYSHYSAPSTTPLRVTVDSGHRKFDFVLEPKGE